MLRSLVGSEMCIRDRAWIVTEVLAPQKQQAHYTGRQPTAQPCNRPPAYCCLLYTSDAADDLLCVDLGGRRIIKKKI